MKKLLLTAALISIFGFANAQTEEGGWLVGVSSNLDFTSTKVDGVTDKNNSLSLFASAGYFVTDNLAAGLNLGLGTSSQGDNSNSSILIGPFVRCYVSDIFIGASFNAVSGSSESGGNKMDYNATRLNFELGYPIWIVDNVAIEPSLVYEKQNSDDFVEYSSFGLNAGFRLYF